MEDNNIPTFNRQNVRNWIRNGSTPFTKMIDSHGDVLILLYYNLDAENDIVDIGFYYQDDSKKHYITTINNIKLARKGLITGPPRRVPVPQQPQQQPSPPPSPPSPPPQQRLGPPRRVLVPPPPPRQALGPPRRLPMPPPPPGRLTGPARRLRPQGRVPGQVRLDPVQPDDNVNQQFFGSAIY